MTIEIFQSDSLGIFFNDCTSNFLDKPSVPLYLENGEPNFHNVVSYSYHNDRTVNIHDAYDTDKFDFSGTKDFDKKNHYRSKSFLAVPLKNHQSETIGVLQLINAIDPVTQEIVDFDPISERFAEAFASQAATVLTKQTLITSRTHHDDSRSRA
ncbi:MAG: GAF domain-containing protein [Methylococcaceae bacterium]|nr:GAF domain-containing protein [Methylococcaceae bacterium]